MAASARGPGVRESRLERWREPGTSRGSPAPVSGLHFPACPATVSFEHARRAGLQGWLRWEGGGAGSSWAGPRAECRGGQRPEQEGTWALAGVKLVYVGPRPMPGLWGFAPQPSISHPAEGEDRGCGCSQGHLKDEWK